MKKTTISPRSLLANDVGGKRLLAVLLLIAVVVPLLNIVPDESSIFHVSSYTVSLVGKYLCFALLALAVDLIWGYCGILSLGHGAFFCTGWLRHGYVFDASNR